MPLDPDERLFRRDLLTYFRRAQVKYLRQVLAHFVGFLNSMGSDINGLRLHAQSQGLAGAVDQRAALGQHDPFFQVLPLAQPHELIALQNLQLKRPTANRQKERQE